MSKDDATASISIIKELMGENQSMAFKITHKDIAVTAILFTLV